jgi:probable metal-binding protein
MNKHIHGHEVMHMMIQSGQVYTRNSLRKAIIDSFGDKTRFYTCSAEYMDADELIDFLDTRGKFLQEEDGFVTNSDLICND